MTVKELKKKLNEIAEDDYLVLMKNTNPSNKRSYNGIYDIDIIDSEIVQKNGISVKEKTKIVILK